MKATSSMKKFARALKVLCATKTLEEVTTEEIVAMAQLSRQTFYKNFADKYELAFWCYEYDIYTIQDKYMKGESSFRDRNLVMLNNFRNDQAFYSNLFLNFEKQNSFFQQYHDFCMSFWPQSVGRQKNNKQLTQIYKLYTYGCNYMVMNWAINGMKETDEEMADLFELGMPECLRFLL